MHSVCPCSLLVWRRSLSKKGTPVTYFCPALDPSLGGSGRKTTTLVRDYDYFMHTKFHQNPSSGSGEEVQNVKVYRRRRTTTDDGRRTDRRTDDGQCAMTIAHLSLRLRWAKNGVFIYVEVSYCILTNVSEWRAITRIMHVWLILLILTKA